MFQMRNITISKAPAQDRLKKYIKKDANQITVGI